MSNVQVKMTIELRRKKRIAFLLCGSTSLDLLSLKVLTSCTCLDFFKYFLYLALKLSQRRRITNWKLNSSILNKQTCEQLTKDITEYLEFSDRDKISPLILWGYLPLITALVLKNPKLQNFRCCSQNY